MRAEAGVEAARRGRARAGRRRTNLLRRSWTAVVWIPVLVFAGLVAAGVLFAGSTERIPAGVTLAGVNVGGLTAAEAEEKLSERAAKLAAVAVVFTAGGERFAIPPKRLDVQVDWSGAVQQALDEGDGPLPLRGLRRVKVRLFGADLEPHAEYYEPGLRFQVQEIARGVDTEPREAGLVLRKGKPTIVPGEAGLRLDQEGAARAIVAALAGFDRRNVPLPVKTHEPDVTAAELVPVMAQVRTALSGPVRFGYRDAHWQVRPAELARLLQLPADGSKELRIGGPAARRYFRNLGDGITRRPRSADFALTASGRVRIVPGRDGRALDIAATEDALLAAALSPTGRRAELVIRPVEPRLTTEEAKALGLKRMVSSYTTVYSGTSDRIRNLQLAIDALDGTLIDPGGTFSFNREVGPRTEARGYGLAPVIINGEYEEGVGGGVSQVATTVFNAAWQAGLKITSRTPHALYISRYPVGRDATVNYPDVDLKFKNDTGHRLFMRARYGDTGITITLLGAGPTRRVVTGVGELREVAAPKVKRERDPTLFVGERVVEDEGEPARAVAVRRTVYVGDKVLYEESWHTTYRSEPKIVRVGTLPKPKEKKPKQSGTTTTGTTPTTTTPPGTPTVP